MNQYAVELKQALGQDFTFCTYKTPVLTFSNGTTAQCVFGLVQLAVSISDTHICLPFLFVCLCFFAHSRLVCFGSTREKVLEAVETCRLIGSSNT
jgi:hypothetical protein